MTIAHLGLQVDSGQVNAASPALEKMANAAKQAENAATQLSRAAGLEDAAVGKATATARLHTAALHAQAAASRHASMMSRQLSYQLIDIGQAIPLAFQSPLYALQNFGFQIAQIGQLYMGQGGMKAALTDAIGQVGRFALKLAPVTIAAGAVAAAIAGMTAAINESSAVTVTFGDTALATWQVVAGGIYSAVKPAIDWLGGTLSTFWDWISPGLLAAGNGIIATFLGAFDAIEIAWGALPSVMGDIAYSVAGSVLEGIEFLLNGARDRINDLIDLANNIPGVAVPKLEGRLEFGINNPYAGAGAGLARDVAGAFSGAFGNDYLGSFFGAISNRAQQNAMARLAADAEGAEKATKSLADNGFGRLIGMTNTFADATRSAFRNLGSGIVDAFRKGGDIAMNFFDMILDRVGQVGENLLNTGLNALLDIGINAIFGGIGGGLGSGAIGRGVYGGMGGFFPAFPGMASGGTVARSGMAWVGERGPELIHVPRGAQVIPHDQSMAMAANQNGANITIESISVHANSEAEGAAGARGFVRELRKHLPAALEQYQRNPLRRAS